MLPTQYMAKFDLSIMNNLGISQEIIDKYDNMEYANDGLDEDEDFDYYCFFDYVSVALESHPGWHESEAFETVINQKVSLSSDSLMIIYRMLSYLRMECPYCGKLMKFNDADMGCEQDILVSFRCKNKKCNGAARIWINNSDEQKSLGLTPIDFQYNK